MFGQPRELVMPAVTMNQLLQSGMHFGHQTRRWNPKMKRFIFGERSGIYIIDLEQTLERVDVAYKYIRNLSANGGTVLFVGTKKQAQDAVAYHAASCGMPYVNFRWLGGMLTNFQTVSKRVSKLRELERQIQTGETEQMIKKEGLRVTREATKLNRNLGGIRGLEKVPDAIFVIDTNKEHIAVTEARRLGIKVIAIVDTNCDPDVVDYAIPGNDDAIRVAQLMCGVVAAAVKEGKYAYDRNNARPVTTKAMVADRAPLDPEAVRKRAEEQERARNEAAAAQKKREQRILENKKAKAAAAAAPAEAAPVEAAPAEAAPAEAAPAAEPAAEATPES